MTDIPTPSGDVLHMKEADPDAGCDIHEWEGDGIAIRLLAAIRAKHGKGGVNACRPCLERVFADRKRMEERGGLG